MSYLLTTFNIDISGHHSNSKNRLTNSLNWKYKNWYNYYILNKNDLIIVDNISIKRKISTIYQVQKDKNNINIFHAVNRD